MGHINEFLHRISFKIGFKLFFNWLLPTLLYCLVFMLADLMAVGWGFFKVFCPVSYGFGIYQNAQRLSLSRLIISSGSKISTVQSRSNDIFQN